MLVIDGLFIVVIEINCECRLWGANYIVVITFVEYVWILIHETLGICQLMIIMGLYDLKLEVQILNESVESLCKTKITVRSVVWLVGCHNFLVVRSRRCWYHHGE